VAAALLATPQPRFYHDHVLVKEAGTVQRTPWHQDQPYYNVDGHGVSAWIATDPVPEGGSLELVADTHCAAGTPRRSSTELRTALLRLYSDANTATDGTLAFDQAFLLATAAARACG
jgi:hypothetical protein